MTRRGMVSGALALFIPRPPPTFLTDSRERTALRKIMRTAEEMAGWAQKKGPVIPPKGSVYHTFWDLAKKGLE